MCLRVSFLQALAKSYAEMAVDHARLKAPHQPSRPHWEQPIEAPHLAEVCARLDDALEAERLYEQLLPYRDNAILAPVATVCCGAAGRYLGMLASVMGEWIAAEEHFQAALDMDERLHAWPWLAHTKHEFASALLTRGRARDRNRAKTLLGEAAASAERIGMPALQQKIRSLTH